MSDSSPQVAFGELWTQPPSGPLTSSFRTDLRNHRDSLDKASASDRQLSGRFESVAQDVSVLRGGSGGDDLDRVFAEAMVGMGELNGGEAAGRRQSLLDIDIDTGIEKKDSVEARVKRVEECLEKLKKVKKDRNDTMEDLKEKVFIYLFPLFDQSFIYFCDIPSDIFHPSIRRIDPPRRHLASPDSQ